MTKDYYNILGISKNATDKDIKKDLPGLIDWYMRQGYELYIDKINE